MDFLDPDKRRAHKIRLYIGYALMGLAISFTAVLLVFQAYGYNLNLRTGDISQKGLVFIDAHPRPAEVYLNGESRGVTDKRFFIPADSYNLELRLDGYRTWKNDFVIMGGRIRRFVYPFLFPENMVSKQVQLYAQKPDFATQSPDRRWLIVRTPNTDFDFSLVDLNSEIASAAALELPENLFNIVPGSHQFELVEWSTDNRHFVIKHVFDGGSEFLLLDRENPLSSLNLSRRFQGVAFSSISLLDKSFDRYYLYDKASGILSTASLQSAETPTVLEGVLDYKTHGDNVILYVTSRDVPAGRVEARLKEGNNTYVMRDFPAESNYLLDVARFEGRWHIVAGASAEQKVYVLRDPQASLSRAPNAALIPASTMRVEDPRFVSFSANARFVAVQSGSTFAVYDSELSNAQRFSLDLDVDNEQKAVWMDGHRLTVLAKGMIHVFDFDGTNQQQLVSSYGGQRPFFNSGYTAIYSFSESLIEGRGALFRTSLIVEN